MPSTLLHIYDRYEMHEIKIHSNTDSNSNEHSNRSFLWILAVLVIVLPTVVNAKIITVNDLEKFRKLDDVEQFFQTQIVLKNRMNTFSSLFQHQMKQEIVNETIHGSKFLLTSLFQLCMNKVQSHREARREAQRLAYQLAKKQMREAFLKEKLSLGFQTLSKVMLIRGGFFGQQILINGILKALGVLMKKQTERKADDSDFETMLKVGYEKWLEMQKDKEKEKDKSNNLSIPIPIGHPTFLVLTVVLAVMAVLQRRGKFPNVPISTNPMEILFPKPETSWEKFKRISFETISFLFNDPRGIFLLIVVIFVFRNQIYDLLQLSSKKSAQIFEVAVNALQKNTDQIVALAERRSDDQHRANQKLEEANKELLAKHNEHVESMLKEKNNLDDALEMCKNDKHQMELLNLHNYHVIETCNDHYQKVVDNYKNIQEIHTNVNNVLTHEQRKELEQNPVLMIDLSHEPVSFEGKLAKKIPLEKNDNFWKRFTKFFNKEIEKNKYAVVEIPGAGQMNPAEPYIAH